MKNTLNFLISITLAFVFFSDLSTAAVENALTAKITKDGFNDLSIYIKDNVLKDLPWTRLPDQEINVAGFSVSLHGIYLTTAFDDLQVIPQNDRLFLGVNLRQLSFFIRDFTIHSILPVTCTNSQFYMGYSSSQPLYSWVQTSLSQHQIKLSPLGSQFDINTDNYAVSGPEECRGIIFSQPLIRFIIEQAFWNAREIIEDMVVIKINDTIPQIEYFLNNTMRNNLSFELKDIPLIPDANLIFEVTPNQMTVSTEGMSFIASIGVKKETLRKERRLLSQVETPKAPINLAEIGFKPEFINSLLKELLRDGSKRLEMTGDISPIFEGGIPRESLSNYLPDLTESEFSSDQLKLFIQLGSSPMISFDPSGCGIRVEIFKLYFIYQAQIKNEWRDYFIFTFDVSLGLLPKIQDKDFILKALKNNSITVSGAWAPDYIPRNPSFDQTQMQKDFTELLNMMAGAEYIFKNELPTIPLRSRFVTFGDLFIKDPYIVLKIVSHEIIAKPAF